MFVLESTIKLWGNLFLANMTIQIILDFCGEIWIRGTKHSPNWTSLFVTSKIFPRSLCSTIPPIKFFVAFERKHSSKISSTD